MQVEHCFCMLLTGTSAPGESIAPPPKRTLTEPNPQPRFATPPERRCLLSPSLSMCFRVFRNGCDSTALLHVPGPSIGGPGGGRPAGLVLFGLPSQRPTDTSRDLPIAYAAQRTGVEAGAARRAHCWRPGCRFGACWSCSGCSQLPCNRLHPLCPRAQGSPPLPPRPIASSRHTSRAPAIS